MRKFTFCKKKIAKGVYNAKEVRNEEGNKKERQEALEKIWANLIGLIFVPIMPWVCGIFVFRINSYISFRIGR